MEYWGKALNLLPLPVAALGEGKNSFYGKAERFFVFHHYICPYRELRLKQKKWYLYQSYSPCYISKTCDLNTQKDVKKQGLLHKKN